VWKSSPYLVLDSSLGCVKEGAIGGQGFNLRNACHWTYLFQPVDCLIGFTASFIMENIGHCLGVFLRGLRLQDMPVKEVAVKFSCHGLQLMVAQRGCPVGSFSINKGGSGGMWERACLAQPADLGGADVMPSLFLSHQEPELLKEVVLHKVQGKGNLTHMKFLQAMLLCMLHALGLEVIKCFQM